MLRIKLTQRPTGQMRGLFPVVDEEDCVRGHLVIEPDRFYLCLRGDNPWDSDKVVVSGDGGDTNQVREATSEWIDWSQSLTWECIVSGGGTSRQRW